MPGELMVTWFAVAEELADGRLQNVALFADHPEAHAHCRRTRERWGTAKTFLVVAVDVYAGTGLPYRIRA